MYLNQFFSNPARGQWVQFLDLIETALNSMAEAEDTYFVQIMGNTDVGIEYTSPKGTSYASVFLIDHPSMCRVHISPIAPTTGAESDITVNNTLSVFIKSLSAVLK